MTYIVRNDEARFKQREHVAEALDGARGCCPVANDTMQGNCFLNQRFCPTSRVMQKSCTKKPSALLPLSRLLIPKMSLSSGPNDTEYGLVAYLHSQDPRRIYRASRALQFGMVAVNRTKVTGAPIPFGGVKQIGLGPRGVSAWAGSFYRC